MKALADALTQNKILKTLSLKGNRSITENGRQELKKILTETKDELIFEAKIPQTRLLQRNINELQYLQQLR